MGVRTDLITPEPIFKAQAERSRKRQQSKHDGLCVIQNELSDTCHCMNRCCWEYTSKGGICTCNRCPCPSAERYRRMVSLF